jgi:nucleotide-binding universal stress UspA family protein
MPIAAIMVYVDFDEGAEARVAAAAGLARQFNAALIGLAGWALRKFDAAGITDLEAPPAGTGAQERIADQLEALGQKFRAWVGENAAGVEWRASLNFPSEVIAREAGAADLIVIGRSPLPGDVYRTFDPGAIILTAGRPVLVVPPGQRSLRASRVLIGWKNTREARRAVFDALPFLKAAESVSIAAAAAPGAGDVTRQQVADVAQYLARHQVASVKQHVVPATGAAEDGILLDLAKEQNVDLIVAGAYGRTRLSEWIFGGVTRQLLLASTVPCLFSS